MSTKYSKNNAPFVRIVYSKIKVNGRLELVPMELYADGSVKKVV